MKQIEISFFRSSHSSKEYKHTHIVHITLAQLSLCSMLVLHDTEYRPYRKHNILYHLCVCKWCHFRVARIFNWIAIVHNKRWKVQPKPQYNFIIGSMSSVCMQNRDTIFSKFLSPLRAELKWSARICLVRFFSKFHCNGQKLLDFSNLFSNHIFSLNVHNADNNLAIYNNTQKKTGQEARKKNVDL